MAASGTQADEPSHHWKAEVVFLKDSTAEDDTLFRNVLWLHRSEAIEYLQYNIRGGVRQRNTLIEHMVDMGDLTDVGMEREDLGPMMSTF